MTLTWARSPGVPGSSASGGVGWRLAGLLPGCVLAIAGCVADADEGLPDDPLGGMPERELREVFRLGGLDVPEEETFSGPPAVEVDRNETLYVLHRDRGEVAVFDASGGFVRWIGGGRGEGPGEFTFPGGMGFVGDTLWIRNRTPPRISLFLEDGTHVGTDRVQVDAGYRTTAGVQGVSGYLQGRRAWMEPDGFIMSPEDDAEGPFMLGDRGMEIRDTLFSWRAGRGRLGGTSFAPLPEPPFHHVALDGSGVLVVDWSDARPEEISLRFFSPDGMELWSRSFVLPAVPLDQRVRDSLVEAGRERVREVRERVIEQGISEEHAPSVPTAEEVRQSVYLPAYYPPIRTARLGVDGTIWLERMEELDAGSWVVLDGDGAPLFEVTLPAEARLRQASQSAVWATLSDDLDIPYVVRWNVVSPASGG